MMYFVTIGDGNLPSRRKHPNIIAIVERLLLAIAKIVEERDVQWLSDLTERLSILKRGGIIRFA